MGEKRAASGRLFCVCLSLSLVLKDQALTFKIDGKLVLSIDIGLSAAIMRLRKVGCIAKQLYLKR